MKVIKKYTAIIVGTNTVNDTVKIDLEYGEITGAHYDRQEPETEFHTEEEAIKYAYEKDECCTWLIVPVVTFEN